MNVEIIVNGTTGNGESRELLGHCEMPLNTIGTRIEKIVNESTDLVTVEVQIAIPTVHVVKEECLGQVIWNRYDFLLITNKQPKPEFVAQSQIRLGYHPNGYGGPLNVRHKQVDGQWHTTWQCFDNCD